MACCSAQDVALLKAEGDKQQGFLDKLLARKKQILDVELPAVCKSVGSMHCWEAVKVGKLTLPSGPHDARKAVHAK